MSGTVDVELLVVPGCPNEGAMVSLLRTVLDELGLSGVGLRTTVIVGPDDAASHRFGGSPTVRINGVDPFGSDGSPSLACRLYPTGTGLSGIPDPEPIRALIAAASRTARLTPPAQPHDQHRPPPRW
jgi:hypothetical protein